MEILPILGTAFFETVTNVYLMVSMLVLSIFAYVLCRDDRSFAGPGTFIFIAVCFFGYAAKEASNLLSTDYAYRDVLSTSVVSLGVLLVLLILLFSLDRDSGAPGYKW